MASIYSAISSSGSIDGSADDAKGGQRPNAKSGQRSNAKGFQRGPRKAFVPPVFKPESSSSASVCLSADQGSDANHGDAKNVSDANHEGAKIGKRKRIALSKEFAKRIKKFEQNISSSYPEEDIPLNLAKSDMSLWIKTLEHDGRYLILDAHDDADSVQQKIEQFMNRNPHIRIQRMKPLAGTERCEIGTRSPASQSSSPSNSAPYQTPTPPSLPPRSLPHSSWSSNTPSNSHSAPSQNTPSQNAPSSSHNVPSFLPIPFGAPTNFHPQMLPPGVLELYQRMLLISHAKGTNPNLPWEPYMISGNTPINLSGNVGTIPEGAGARIGSARNSYLE